MPLRVRLTLWYGSALAIVLIIFSVVLYAMTSRNLRDAMDQSLEETADDGGTFIRRTGVSASHR